MGGGGQQQQAPTQTTTYTPSPQQQELMNLALPGVRQFAASTPTRYQGQVSPFDPSQVAGQNLALGAAGGQQDLADVAAQQTEARLSQDPNAMRDEAINAAVRPIYQNLTEKDLPAIRQNAVTQGGFGGSRQA